jgi:hypothetical protein
MMQRRDLLKLAAAGPILPISLNTGFAAQDDDTTDSTSVTPDGAILPHYRVLSYYGFPGNELMGILGEFDKETLLRILREQAAVYEALDPSRPIKLAFEVIASVAQAGPMEDGSYLAYADDELIQEYVDFTRDNDLLLLLDMQFGRRTVQDEVAAAMKWLEEPHVHLALDPEFSVNEGEVPGQVLGKMNSREIRYAQDALATFCAERGLPPKMLIIHQFNMYSITDREEVEPVEGVQFVLEVDGWGYPDLKRETYAVVAGGEPIEFYGFKLWYRQDVPLMTEAEVLALTPSPDLIIYQ